MYSIGGISRVVVEVACFPLSAEKKNGGIFWVGYAGWQFLAFLCLGEKLPRWTELARKCWNLSSSARLSWVEFCEWKFLSFPLSGCKLLRWSFLGGSSLQCSCSFLEFLFWNLRDLLASLFLQTNFLGGVSWVGYPGWQFLAFLCLGEKLPRWTELARKCWNLSSSARLSWVEFCEWKFLSFPLSGCKLLRWSFLGGSSLQCSCSFLESPCWNLRDLLASLFLQENFLGGVSGWGILACNFFLFFVLGKNWLEIAGIFLPQQDFPGWSFVSGNSLVSRCVVASYLGGVSWVEVPCSAPAPSWNSLFGI